MTSKGYVLSLCDRTGRMVEPWLLDGYEAVTIDLQSPPCKMYPGAPREHLQADVTGTVPYEAILERGKPVAIFAFPPCTHLAASGARWWKDKGLDALVDGLRVVSACVRICEAAGVPYLLENPNGALSTHWRKPDHSFDPCDLAGYAPDPDEEAYTKRTCYWIGGGLKMPRARRVEPALGSLMHGKSQSADRANERSVTPYGLAYGVFEANEPERVRRAAELAPETA